MRLIYSLQLLILAVSFTFTKSQPPGWRMIDRFYGFRYEIIGGDVSLIESVKKEADNKGCFGWIQRSLNNNLVGEARYY